MCLKIIFLVLFLIGNSSLVLAELHRCDGIWQNKECEVGQSSVPVTKKISKIEKGSYPVPKSESSEASPVKEVNSKVKNIECKVTPIGVDVRIVSANVSVRSSLGNKIENITLKVENFSEENLFSVLYVGLYPLGRIEELAKYRIADSLNARSTTSYTLPAIVTKPNSPYIKDYAAILLYEPAKQCNPYPIRMSSATTSGFEAINSSSYLKKIEKELDILAENLNGLKRRNPIVWSGDSEIAAEKVKLQTRLNSICSRTKETRFVASRVANQCRDLALEINKFAR